MLTGDGAVILSRCSTLLVTVLAACLGLLPFSGRAQVTEELVRSYLWPQTEAELDRAEDALASDPAIEGLSRMQMHDLAEWMRRGPVMAASGGDVEAAADQTRVVGFNVTAPGGRRIPVLALLPSRYTPEAQWPLMLAMHGGPTGDVEGSMAGAERMLQVWAEPAETFGWIVVSPAMVSTVARDGRTQDRLPYEIFHPEEARAVVDFVRARYSVNPDRIVSTGISLGSNFSIGFAAAHPDWLAAIVPVSTEGDSRERLLRNLASVPTYVLEGTQDQNIRGVGGPRSLADILTDFGNDLVYREFADRAHEGFQEHYPDVLRWLDSRPRRTAPPEIVRVPHSAIMPVSRRVHWLESDTRQALVRARVSGPSRIDVEARWARSVTLFLSDDLVDLDGPVSIYLNGERAFDGSVLRSARTALGEARRLNDERRVYAASVTLSLPSSEAAVARAIQLAEDLEPTRAGGVLSFWEMYAQRAIEERFPSVGFQGDEAALPGAYGDHAPEQMAVLIRSIEDGGPADRAGLEAGDVLLSVGGEPFFEGRGGVAGLYTWMVRELRTNPTEYELEVWRDGAVVVLKAIYQLGPYRLPQG